MILDTSNTLSSPIIKFFLVFKFLNIFNKKFFEIKKVSSYKEHATGHNPEGGLGLESVTIKSCGGWDGAGRLQDPIVCFRDQQCLSNSLGFQDHTW